MSTLVWGMLLGALTGVGALLVGLRVAVLRRPQLSIRVLPYVRDVPRRDAGPVLRTLSSSPTTAAAGIFGPLLRSAAELVERVLGGSSSVRRRLQRAGLDRTVQEFRVEQVVWGLGCFAAMAAIGLVRTLSGAGDPVSALVFCVLGLGFGVLVRDNRLSAQVKERERQILTEFPTVA